MQEFLIAAVVKYVLPPVALAFAGLIASVLNSARLYLQAHADTSKAASVGARLVALAQIAYHDTEQTFRPTIKTITEDGKLTPEDAKAVGDAALSTYKRLLTPDGIDQVLSVLNVPPDQLDAYLKSHLEAEVSRSKIPAPFADVFAALGAAGVAGGASPALPAALPPSAHINQLTATPSP